MVINQKAALISVIIFFILIPIGLAYTPPQYCTVSVDEITLENITGTDPETFCLGDRVRVSAEVILTGNYNPIVFLDLYVDDDFYETKTVYIPLALSTVSLTNANSYWFAIVGTGFHHGFI